MRIVLLGPYYPDVGGVQVYNTMLAGGLVKRGHEVTVVSYGWARSRWGERVIRLPSPRVPGVRGASFMAASALRLAAGLGDADVVVAQYAKTSGVAAWIARAFGGPPYVPVFHGTDALVGAGAWLVRRACRSAPAVAAVSSHLAGVVRERFGVEPRVVRGGVDVEAFRSLPGREEVREEMGIPAEARVVGIVGSLVPVRDPELALRAALSHPDALVLVAGDGPLRPRLEELARREGAGRVTFLGKVPHERIPLVLRACDLTLHTPRWEGFGLSALESMAAGTPPLAARVGALPEFVRDGRTGFLADRSLEAISERLREVFSDPEGLERVSRGAREFALSRGWDAVAGEFESLLEEVVS
ncbi:MAG: hypothetical protein DRO01_00225 [Thermoproteota archaeon]|nr:MAG: hypothetical protein DRO01_00225 [Candidatus Korarchaeota archaeon]